MEIVDIRTKENIIFDSLKMGEVLMVCPWCGNGFGVKEKDTER